MSLCLLFTHLLLVTTAACAAFSQYVCSGNIPIIVNRSFELTTRRLERHSYSFAHSKQLVRADGINAVRRILSVNHTLSSVGRALLRKLGIKYFSMYEIDKYGIADCVTRAIKAVNPK